MEHEQFVANGTIDRTVIVEISDKAVAELVQFGKKPVVVISRG